MKNEQQSGLVPGFILPSRAFLVFGLRFSVPPYGRLAFLHQLRNTQVTQENLKPWEQGSFVCIILHPSGG
jgi:hypothetical protein